MRFTTAAVAAIVACSQLVTAGWDTMRSIKRDDAASTAPLYPAHNFSMPIDHFKNESMYEPHDGGKFNNRYWFDDTYYKPGGPVFLLISGEINGDYRLPILQTGIIYQFNKLFGGLGVVLEHRYFGRSQPQPDLSTKSYRFCTTDQALADAAYFAENIVFPGHEHENMTAHARPWITYGGSYAGAFVAFLRTQYPGVFWGSISSSGVTKAIWDFWQYFEPIIQYGPKQCIQNTQKLTNMIDNILLGNHTTAKRRRDTDAAAQKGNRGLIQKLKDTFSLGGISYDNDFTFALQSPIGGWQSLNWDPAINSSTWGEFCGNMSASKPLYANTDKTKDVQNLLVEGGYGSSIQELTTPLLNYIGYSNATLAAPCAKQHQTQDQCYSTHNSTAYKQTDFDQWDLKSWPYMWCTQWGFLQTGSGAPKDQLPLVSRTIDLDYSSIICREAFGINKPADTDKINSRGGFDIAYPRLAIVGGKLDPWRPATPLADNAGYQKRPNTTDQPLFVLDDGVHHWDENGLLPNETTPELPPGPVRISQDQQHKFVKAWLDEAKGHFPAPY